MTWGRPTRIGMMVLVVIGLGFEARPVTAQADSPRASRPTVRRVGESGLAVRVEPSNRAFATGTLTRGAEVQVRAERSGWAEIEAPADTFLWVDAAGVRTQEDSGATLAVGRRALLRFGADGESEPGPPHPLGSLPAGTPIRGLDLPEVVIGDGPRTQTWWAIAPPEGEVRFVRLDGLAPTDDPATRPRSEPRPQTPTSAKQDRRPDAPTDPDVDRVSLELASGADDTAGLPPEVVAELTAIAAEVRSVRSRPFESWDLTPIRGRYEALLRRFGSEPTVRAVVQARLDATERAAAAAQAARELDRLLRDGDQIDAEVANARRRLAQAQNRNEREFDATGFLQPSAKRYQGQKVLALIGSEGKAVGYVQIPPGVPVQRYLTHRIGVRGVVRFDQNLGARLISARDLEVLDQRR